MTKHLFLASPCYCVSCTQQTGKPLLKKPISVELGSVTPRIVVPPPKGKDATPRCCLPWLPSPCCTQRTGEPLLNKPISAELGSVTPCIVVPPPKGTQWTQEQMRVQAHNVAAGLLHNCGHNCLGLEVGVGWGTDEVWYIKGLVTLPIGWSHFATLLFVECAWCCCARLAGFRV